MVRTRFAPSPTGPLHLGHAYSALTAFDFAHTAGGTFLLRIEDTDFARCKPEWETQIYDDLHWLGVTWPAPARRQSDHLGSYDAALDQLGAAELLYPCACNRSDIRAAASAPQGETPLTGPDGIVYPGTCRHRAFKDRRPGDALRLNMAKAIASIADVGSLYWTDIGAMVPGTVYLAPDTLINTVGDVVLARRLVGTAAYHLAVTLDDAAQSITHVVRGADLIEVTQIHVLLQALLGLPTPIYLHHRLITDEAGKRLAKRDDARALSTYRDQGLEPSQIRGLLAL
jgi:glutamyl-Q tRNA(Asp) synthetase